MIKKIKDKYELPKELIYLFLIILVGFSFVAKYNVLRHVFLLILPWFFIPWFNKQLTPKVEDRDQRWKIIFLTMMFLSVICIEISFFKGLSKLMFPSLFIGTLLSVVTSSLYRTKKIEKNLVARIIIPLWSIVLIIPFLEVFIQFGKMIISK